MRAASRLLASVKQTRFLEPGSPTGLTGLHAHPAPRSTLIYLYNSTLEKLKQIPENSVYRQATENLTKHRLQIVEKVKPAGFDEWQTTVNKQFGARLALRGELGGQLYSHGGQLFVRSKEEEPYDEDEVEWDGQDDTPELEGTRTAEERKGQRQAVGHDMAPEEDEDTKIEIDPEPRYTLEQVEQLETELGAGLLEEVIQVAEGEHQLVDTLIESKAWEELEVKAPEGQWKYFERKT